jgi:carboxyl-terminal processing protease
MTKFLSNRQYCRMIGSLLAVLITASAMVLPSALAHTPQSLYDDVWKLVNVRFVDENKNGQDWRIWRHRYDDELETDADAYVAIETMLASLDDRYSRFLNPDAFADEGQSIKATLFGIGIQIGNRGNKLLIIAPIEDTPADKAGLQAEDEIIKINDVEAKGMNVKDAADLIRGKKGTFVKLLIRRGDEANDKKANVEEEWYNVQRDEIKLKSIEKQPPLSTKIPKDIGYVRLTTFLSSNAASELKDVIEANAKKKGMILDLRSNPGGLLANAIVIADFFLDEEAIVSTVDRDSYKDIQYATDRVLNEKPLVVLIDKGSASASEILSGALRDNNRAILIGQTSFGKGLVQEINQLPGGSGINLTTQRYLTPNDTDINKTGIVPDITVEITKEDVKAKRDRQLETAIDVMNDWLDGKSMKYLQSRSLVSKK